jgi:hypothetical protein
MELTAQNVMDVTIECFPQDDEPREGCIETRGITAIFQWVPERLEARKADILDMLHQLPESFRVGVNRCGEGDSFLSACMTKDGVHWGEHAHMEALFCLGIGVGAVEFPLPRELWKILPGGMPYVCVTV